MSFKSNSRVFFGLIIIVLLSTTLFMSLLPNMLPKIVLGSPDWLADWPYRKQITIDHTKVAADLTDFPVLMSLTDADLAAHAQSNGYDIAFIDDNANQLNHEIERYNPTNGELTAWVQVPSLSSTVDTVLYVYYGNPSASNQQNKTGVWDSNYKMVQHLNQISGTQYDSTANGHNAVPNGGVGQGVTGKIDGADSFAGDASQYLSVGSITASDWTISFWANSKSTNYVVIYPIGLGAQTGIGMGGTYPQVANSFYFYDGINLPVGGPSVQTNTWYYVVVTKSGTSCTIYVNGVSQVSGTILNVAITNLYIGRRIDGYPFNGIIDEVRVSNTTRNSALISTEHSNQQAPSIFYSVGSEEALQFPPKVSDPSPADGTTEVSTSLSKLDFSLTDPNNDMMNYVVTTSPNIGFSSGTNVPNGRYDVSVSGIQPNTAYTWRVSAKDPAGSGQWNNVTFSFTISGYVGQSWLLGWQYRKSHVITSAAGAGTSYQTEVKVCYLDSTPSWFTVLPTNIPLFMTNDVSSNGTVFAGDSNYNIYKSTDCGITFTNIFTIPTQSNNWGLMAGRVWTTFVDSRDYVFVSAGGTNRLYRSINYGTSFSEVLNMPDRTTYADADIISMTEDASGNLYGAEYADTMPPGGSRLWKSTDGGGTWSSVSKTWSARHLHAVKYNPSNGWIYVVLGEGGGADYQTVWRSKDSGNNWACVVERAESDPYATKYLPIEFMGSDVYLGQDHQGATETNLIQKITDNGAGPYTPVTVYNNTYYAAIMTSATKLGDTMMFSSCSESVNPATCQVVMSNDGSTWTVLNAQPVSTAYIYINRLTVHPRTGFVYGCINYNYCYYIASPSTPRPPPLQPPASAETVVAEGHCRTDFGDIRFTDNDGITPLEYWMETKTDGDNAIFWVKVADDLGSADRTIYVYYGKSDATTTSNPDNTFLFYDDFNGDLSKWTTISGTWTAQSGNLVIQPQPSADNNYLITKSFLATSNIAIITRIRSEEAGTAQAHPGLIWHANTGAGTSQRNDQVYFRTHDTSPSSTQGNIQPAWYDGIGGAVGIHFHDYKAGSYYTWNTWSIVEVRIPSSGNVTLYGNDRYWHSWGNQQFTNDHIGVVAHANGKDYFDYVIVRKYVDPEPAHSTWGSEEQSTRTLLYIDPPLTEKTRADVGTNFWVNVTVKDITDLRGFDFNVTWENSLLTLTSVDYTTTLNNIWGSGNWECPVEQSGAGYYKLVAVSTANSFTSTGPTPLYELTFTVQDPQSNFPRQTLIHFDTHKLSDSQADLIPNTVSDGTYTISGETPTLQMSPTSKICRMYGETLTVSIAVSNEFDVTDFEFGIHYNTTLLDYSGITWNAWGPDSSSVIVDEANGIVTGSTTGSEPISGTQTLVTVQFTAAYYHIWKVESKVAGWKNDQSGTIFFQSANLSYSGGDKLHYVRGGVSEVSVGSDVAYTFSPIQGDIDNNGSVDVIDLGTVAKLYDQANSTYDLNGDDMIDIFDLALVGANFWYTYLP